MREKLGWLEETHLAGASLMYNYDVSTLYAKMAADMRDAQMAGSGLVPDIAPEYTTFPDDVSRFAGVGRAVILSPWTAYQFYGDLRVSARRSIASMQRYAEYLRGASAGTSAGLRAGRLVRHWAEESPGAHN